ncbi:MAG: Crp/Fnr family transcriptional regulator [Actinomycetota bacterium]
MRRRPRRRDASLRPSGLPANTCLSYSDSGLRRGLTPARLPQSTLAELLGATRPAVNRVLKGLESDGLIRLGYREIEVADPRALERIAATS